MRIQLDTVAKTIKIEESILLGEFINKLKVILPNKLWKEFTLIPEIISNWTSPIIIPVQPYWPTPYIPCTPPYYPWITYTATTGEAIGASLQSGSGDGGGTTTVLNSGIYNIEIQ